jgi:hypothetical protein
MREKLGLYNKHDVNIGTLTKDGENYTVELKDGFDVVDVPFHFRKEYSEGLRVFKDNDVFYWIVHRIIPKERQNLNHILNELGMERYDEWEMFKAYSGRTVRDHFYVLPIMQ